MIQKPITIGNVTDQPGSSVRGGIPIGADLDGNVREIPITVSSAAAPAAPT